MNEEKKNLLRLAADYLRTKNDNTLVRVQREDDADKRKAMVDGWLVRHDLIDIIERDPASERHPIKRLADRVRSRARDRVPER